MLLMLFFGIILLNHGHFVIQCHGIASIIVYCYPFHKRQRHVIFPFTFMKMSLSKFTSAGFCKSCGREIDEYGSCRKELDEKPCENLTVFCLDASPFRCPCPHMRHQLHKLQSNDSPGQRLLPSVKY